MKQTHEGLTEIGNGIWRWERRHPEWHPGDFGARVGSYLLHDSRHTLLIDPLLSGCEDPLLETLDRRLAGPVRILITIPYHTRSAEFLQQRYRKEDALILGHRLVARRLGDTTGFKEIRPGDRLDGIAFHPIGRPVRAEMPVEIPSLRALAFGDAIVEFQGELRLWESPLTGPRRRLWYAERLLPTLQRLLDLDFERVLVTHGRPVLTSGRQALGHALERGPWQRPKSS